MKVWSKITPLLSVALVAAGCAGMQGGRGEGSSGMALLNGTSLEGWQQVGPGEFTVQPDGSVVTEGGMGLLYYAERPFRDFVLELDYQADSNGANSGVFVRFPERPNTPADAVRGGYEIQIDNNAQDPVHMTGAIYGLAAPSHRAAKPAGEWNHYRIEVTGQRYQVYLNGEKVNDFVGDRAREGYIGLQNHDPDSRVRFKNVRVAPLRVANAPETLGDIVAVREKRAPIRVLMVTETQGWRHHEAIAAAKEVMPDVAETTEFEIDITEDINDLNREKLANYDLLFLALSTLRAGPEETETDETVEGNTYWISLETPQGIRTGQLSLAGEAGQLTGTISMGGSTMPLEEIQLAGPNLTFAFNGGDMGRVRGSAMLKGRGLVGTLTGAGTEMALTGNRSKATVSGQHLSGYTPVNEAQRQAILDFVREGKGLVGVHAAVDAFYGWDEYRELVGGGLFEAHPWTQHVRIDVEDPTNPAVSHLGDSFGVRDEIYVLDQNPRWNSHVLLSLNMPSVGVEQGSATATPEDYPISWIRPYGEGRVFVTTLGHFADVWRSPAFMQHLLQGMRMAAGRLEADIGGHRVKETIAKDVWPDDLVVDERGNVWIVELTGRVLRYDAATKQTTEIAQINTTDPTNIEHGIMGVEIDPNFYSGEPYLYIYYTEPESFINTLSRFTYQDGKLDLGSEKVVLRVPTEPQCCHQAGDLEWGPNQTLFVSTGDTGQSGTKPDQEISEERIQQFVERNELTDYHWSRLVDSERTAQNLQDLRGKILRVNKDGSIPKDNPFYGKPGVRWEIYAYGLRNPYRIKHDEETGRMFIGIVGPDEQTTYDWYDISNGGENFGWPRVTGPLFYNEWTPEMIPGYKPPAWEYTYATGSRSASGGPIYRSNGRNAFPQLQGKALMYDWSRKWIKYGDIVNGTFESDTTGDVRSDGRQFRIPAKRLANIKTFDVLDETSPISIDVGPDGCLYLAEFDGFWRPSQPMKSNVSRYCWEPGSAQAGRAPGATAEQSSP